MATEKQFQSGLPDLITQMFGTKSSQKQTQTQNTTSNTAPLQAVFDRAQAPMDQQLYDSLIASIFQKAAVQVPTLTAALANATGSRTSNNSPLALALNEQNNMAAKDSAAAILGQQNIQAKVASDAAQGIAQGTKSTTTSQANSGTAGKPGLDPLLTTALGFLLNKADKGKWFDKMTGVFSPTPATNFPVAAPSFGTATGGGTTTSFAENMPVLNAAAPTSLAGEFGGGSFDSLLAGFGGAPVSAPAPADSLSNFDFSSLLSGGFDDGSNFGVDSILSGFGGSDLSSAFGGGNALTGGLTGGGSELLTEDIWNFFADGGSVQRNRNNMGRSPTLFGQSAINAPAKAVATGGGGNVGVSSDMLMQLLERTSQTQQVTQGRPRASQAATESQGDQTQGPSQETAGGAINARAGNPFGNSIAQALAMAALGMIAPQVMAGVTGSLPAAQLTNIGIKAGTGQSTSSINLVAALAKAISSERAATSAIETSEDPLGAMIASFAAIDQSVGDVSGLSSDVLAAGANATSSVTGINPLEALLASTNAFSTGTQGDGPGLASGNDFGGLGGASDFGGNAFGGGLDGGSSLGFGDGFGGGDFGSDFGGGGDGFGDFADGGMTTMSVKRASKGMIPTGGKKVTGTEDNIKAKSTVPGGSGISVSGKEFIVPADVTSQPGVQAMLESLLQKFHTPVNR